MVSETVEAQVESSPKMTQVASSQSPESQPLGNSASEIGDSYDEDVDMLADEDEGQALADNLLGETLADLPDLPTAVMGNLKQASVQENTMTATVQRQNLSTIESPSSQKTYRDPMDLSNFFGSDEGDANADGESDDEIETSPSTAVPVKAQAQVPDSE